MKQNCKQMECSNNALDSLGVGMSGGKVSEGKKGKVVVVYAHSLNIKKKTLIPLLTLEFLTFVGCQSTPSETPDVLDICEAMIVAVEYALEDQELDEVERVEYEYIRDAIVEQRADIRWQRNKERCKNCAILLYIFFGLGVEIYSRHSANDDIVI